MAVRPANQHTRCERPVAAGREQPPRSLVLRFYTGEQRNMADELRRQGESGLADPRAAAVRGDGDRHLVAPGQPATVRRSRRTVPAGRSPRRITRKRQRGSASRADSQRRCSVHDGGAGLKLWRRVEGCVCHMNICSASSIVAGRKLTAGLACDPGKASSTRPTPPPSHTCAAARAIRSRAPASGRHGEELAPPIAPTRNSPCRQTPPPGVRRARAQ